MELKQLMSISECHTELTKPINQYLIDGRLEDARSFMISAFQRIHENSAEAMSKAVKLRDYNVLYNHVRLLQTTCEELRDIDELIMESPPGSENRRAYQEQVLRQMYNDRSLNKDEFRQLMMARGFDPDKVPEAKGLGDLLMEAIRSHSEDCPIHGKKDKGHVY